jgi:hypothetical protein
VCTPFSKQPGGSRCLKYDLKVQICGTNAMLDQFLV